MNFLQNELYKFLVNLAKSFEQELHKDTSDNYINGYDDGIKYCIENIEAYAETFKNKCEELKIENGATNDNN